MVNINQKVWSILSKHISVQKDLQRGIINIRGLAKLLIKENNIEGSLDSVISAIRRFETNIALYEEEIKSALKDAKIFTRNNITSVKLSTKEGNNIILYKNWPEFIKECVISSSSDVTNIILESDKADELINSINKNNLVDKKDNLSEIKILLNKKAMETKGILAKIANEIYVNEINIEEMIVNLPEILIYVKDKDFVKATETLHNLSSK